MEYRLAGLVPERVFYYFEELTRIPHGSYNTKAVSDYCLGVVKGLGLSCVQDEYNNLIAWKPASAGLEKAPSVMLQGHLDMVAEKDSGSPHDFTKDPLDLFVEDGWIGAKGTTLGGDDGAGVALMLALLEDDSFAHPALECVFTTEEEVGMDGAKAIDLSGCKSRYLINLDSEEEGYMLASCAGGMRCGLKLPVGRAEMTAPLYTVTVGGLYGGHSGCDIDQERGNANILMGRLLFGLAKEIPFAVVSIGGGTKDNAITRECRAVLAVEEAGRDGFFRAAREMEGRFRQEYAVSDPGVLVSVEEKGKKTVQAVRPEDQRKVIFLLTQCPYGVQHMSADIKGLVETSLNLGILLLEGDCFESWFSVRSNVASRKRWLAERLECLAEFLGGEFCIEGDYPAWPFEKESRLRDLIADVYRKVSGGKEMVTQALHAGLECGLLVEKLPGLDAVSLGPDMRDVHTPRERLNIASVGRTYRLLREILSEIGEKLS